MSDLNSLRGAALAMTGIAAHLVAETTGSKAAARVETWVDHPAPAEVTV
jgi:hypothetical protein